MKTATIQMYGNIAVSLKKDDTLIYLEYICSVSSPLRRHGLSLRLRHWAF